MFKVVSLNCFQSLFVSLTYLLFIERNCQKKEKWKENYLFIDAMD